jgi:hypothetical protein
MRRVGLLSGNIWPRHSREGSQSLPPGRRVFLSPIRWPGTDLFGLGSPLNRGSSAPSSVDRSRAVQHSNTATSSTASGSERLRSTADLPQRPRATSPPRVRIEGVRGSNPLSSTFPRSRAGFNTEPGSLGFRTASEYSNPSHQVACRAACARFWSWLSAPRCRPPSSWQSGCAEGSARAPGWSWRG